MAKSAHERTHSVSIYDINQMWFLLEMPFDNYKFDFKLKLQKDNIYIYLHELNYIIATNCFMPLGQSSGN